MVFSADNHVLIRGRLNFGFGFGTESDSKSTLNLVSVERTVMSFGFSQNYEWIQHRN